MFENLMKIHGYLRIVLATALVAMFTGVAHASVPLPPGVVGAGLPGTRSAWEGDIAGTVLRDALIPFEIRNGAGALLYRGQLQDRVVRSTATAEVHFYSQIRGLDGALSGRVARIDRFNFSGYDCYVDYRLDGTGTVAPVTASRSALPGVQVRFNFSPSSGLGSGERSRFCMIKTSGRNYAVTGTTVITLMTGEQVALTTAMPVP